MFFSRRKFPSSETLEQEEKQKITRYREFIETENSDVLKEYKVLHKIVSSPEFQEEKKRLQSLKFKGSKEFAEEKEYNKLSRNRALKLYLSIQDSKQLEAYLAFKNTPEFKDIEDKAKRKESQELTSFYAFHKSKPLKAYKNIINSTILKRYTELKKRMGSEEFIAFKNLCNDQQRWEKTEQFKQESKYNELVKSSSISHYLKYGETDYFDEQKKWDIEYEESFKDSKIDSNKWVKSLYWVKELGDNLYSSEDEFQAFNGDSNLHLNNNTLRIVTKKEAGQGKFWDTESGFINKHTAYTSAVLSSLNSFKSDEGMLKIKFKLSGNKFVNHTAWLGTQENKQSILLYKAQNKQCSVGTLSKSKSGIDKAIEEVRIVPFYRDYHIFTAEWNSDEIIWKVNNLEIHKAKNNLKKSPLQLIINSTVTDEKKSGDGQMTIDWIRSYKKKQMN